MDESVIDKEREGLPGCSELHRVMACPGYLTAKARFPKTQAVVKKETKSGTEIHEALEMMEYIIDGAPVEMSLTAAQQWVTDQSASIVARITTELFAGEKPQKMLIEQRMFMTQSGEKVLAGKPDKCSANSKWDWLIVDYKTGPKPYPAASDNWQIHGNVLCLESHIGKTEDLQLGGAIYGAVIQPLVSLLPQIVKITPEAARAVKRQIVDALVRSKQPGQPRIPGEHCAYCPVVSRCFEAQSTGMIMEKKFTDVTSLSVAQLAALQKILPQIEARCQEVREHIKAMLWQDGNAIPGLELIEQGNGFVVEDKIGFLKAIMPVVSKQEFTDALKVPVTQIKEAWIDKIVKSGATDTKKNAEAMWNDQVGPYLVPRPKKLIIKRKAEDGGA